MALQMAFVAAGSPLLADVAALAVGNNETRWRTRDTILGDRNRLLWNYGLLPDLGFLSPEDYCDQ